MRNMLKLQKGLVRIAISLNMYRFASSLIGVFIPLVIIKTGGHLWEVAAFYLFYSLFKLCINYPVVVLIRGKGAHFGLGCGFVAGAFQMLSILGYA